MGIEDSGTPKNPWGRGDERAKELGPDVVKEIREELLNRYSQNKRVQGVEGTVTSSFSDRLRDVGGDPDRMVRKQFVTSLKAAGGHFEYTFPLTEEGLIPRSYFVSEKSEQSMLAVCSTATGKNADGVIVGWHPNDLMTAAQKIMEEFPEVRFNFVLQPKTFSYTAEYEEKKEG